MKCFDCGKNEALFSVDCLVVEHRIDEGGGLRIETESLRGTTRAGLCSRCLNIASSNCSDLIGPPALGKAAGYLFACEGMPEEMRYGDVKTGIDPQAWSRVTAPCAIRKECEHCVFLPQCTEFDRCNTRLAYDDCFRQEKRGLENELRFVYAAYREWQRKKRQPGEAEQSKEAACVSD